MDRTRRQAVAAAAVIAVLTAGGCASGTSAAERQAHRPRGREVPVRILALDGPLDPSGPFAATSLPALMHLLRAARGGRAPVCAAACWHAAKIPPASVLIAARYAWDTCFTLRRVTSGLAGRTLDLDVRPAPVCPGGGGAATRAGDALLAVPLRSLPHGTVSIRVRGAQTGGPRAMAGTSVRR